MTIKNIKCCKKKTKENASKDPPKLWKYENNFFKYLFIYFNNHLIKKKSIYIDTCYFYAFKLWKQFHSSRIT